MALVSIPSSQRSSVKSVVHLDVLYICFSFLSCDAFFCREHCDLAALLWPRLCICSKKSLLLSYPLPSFALSGSSSCCCQTISCSLLCSLCCGVSVVLPALRSMPPSSLKHVCSSFRPPCSSVADPPKLAMELQLISSVWSARIIYRLSLAFVPPKHLRDGTQEHERARQGLRTLWQWYSTPSSTASRRRQTIYRAHRK